MLLTGRIKPLWAVADGRIRTWILLLSQGHNGGASLSHGLRIRCRSWRRRVKKNKIAFVNRHRALCPPSQSSSLLVALSASDLHLTFTSLKSTCPECCESGSIIYCPCLDLPCIGYTLLPQTKQWPSLKNFSPMNGWKRNKLWTILHQGCVKKETSITTLSATTYPMHLPISFTCSAYSWRRSRNLVVTANPLSRSMKSCPVSIWQKNQRWTESLQGSVLGLH